MSYAHPVQRAALIKGLRALADYLESNPDVPTTIDATLYAFPPKRDCAVMRAEIDALAETIGSQAHEAAGGRHYLVTRPFGPVEYRALAICKDACHASSEETEG